MGGPGHGERKRVRNKTREKVNMPSTTATRSHMRRDTPVGGEQGDQRGPRGGGQRTEKGARGGRLVVESDLDFSKHG